MKINVGNMSFSTTDEELRELFSRYGTVASAEVVTDSEKNHSRGFGFVEMPNQHEGEKAIRSLNGDEFAGRKIRVNEIKPSKEK
ncbi:MAG: RNA-binding protein [Mariprofundaceae bacterium]